MDDRLHQNVTNTEDDDFATARAVAAADTTSESFQGDDAAAAQMHLSRGMTHSRPELADAFEASFRRPAAMATRSIAGAAFGFGPLIDTRVYPFRAVAHLTIEAADGTFWRGSAFFASARTLVTAGHNVFIPERSGWVRSIVVAPGRNGHDFPYDEVTSTKFFTVRGWSDARDPNYDYGAIVLPEPLGITLGFFGLHEPLNGELGRPVDVSGYADEPGRQWFGSGQIRERNDLRLYYDVSTAGGQSGAPVWFNGAPSAIAVHAYDSGNLNSGVRINPRVHNQIRAWLV
jgi:glutamyl endopeptidase